MYHHLTIPPNKFQNLKYLPTVNNLSAIWQIFHQSSWPRFQHAQAPPQKLRKIPFLSSSSCIQRNLADFFGNSKLPFARCTIRQLFETRRWKSFRQFEILRSSDVLSETSSLHFEWIFRGNTAELQQEFASVYEISSLVRDLHRFPQFHQKEKNERSWKPKRIFLQYFSQPRRRHKLQIISRNHVLIGARKYCQHASAGKPRATQKRHFDLIAWH